MADIDGLLLSLAYFLKQLHIIARGMLQKKPTPPSERGKHEQNH